MSGASGWVVAAPAVIAWAVIAWLRRSALAGRLADHPNERSLHRDPTPRVGGLGVLAGAVPIALLGASTATLTLLVLALALALVSAIDDVRSLPIELRLPAHAMAAIVALLAIAAPTAGQPDWGWIYLAAGVVAIAWMTNLFNFMDGADGLAAGMAIIGFGALAIAATIAGAHALAWTALSIASACGGFLAHNFPPARVFLGDAGSIPLGFLAATLGVLGIRENAWPWWFALLVFSPFIVDATLTVVQRLLRGAPIWRAHREHLYQRMALAGLPRPALALWAYGLMTAVAASALLALRQGEMVQCAIIFAWLVLYVILITLITRLFPVVEQ